MLARVACAPNGIGGRRYRLLPAPIVDSCGEWIASNLGGIDMDDGIGQVWDVVKKLVVGYLSDLCAHVTCEAPSTLSRAWARRRCSIQRRDQNRGIALASAVRGLSTLAARLGG